MKYNCADGSTIHLTIHELNNGDVCHPEWATAETQRDTEELAQHYWLLVDYECDVFDADELYNDINWITGWGDPDKRDDVWDNITGRDAPFICDIDDWIDIYRETVRFELAVRHAAQYSDQGGSA